MPSAIIIGATSGIGRALALQLATEGYRVGIAGRREPLLDSLLPQLGAGATKRVVDLSDAETAVSTLRQWIEELGQVDLAVITATYSQDHKNLEWEPIYQSIVTNVLGTTAVTNIFMEHFLQRGAGHLVVFTSLAEIRGNDERPAYGASKAFISRYAGGLRMKLAKMGSPIKVLVVQPGTVDTDQIAGMSNLFWVVSPEKAARQISRAIARGKTHIYVSRRWRLIAWVMKLLPNFIFDRVPQATHTKPIGKEVQNLSL